MKQVTVFRMFLLAITLFLGTSIVNAQPPDEPDPVNAPIDGGVTLLVAAAIGYGAKKAHAARKKGGSQETGGNRH